MCIFFFCRLVLAEFAYVSNISGACIQHFRKSTLTYRASIQLSTTIPFLSSLAIVFPFFKFAFKTSFDINFLFALTVPPQYASSEEESLVLAGRWYINYLRTMLCLHLEAPVKDPHILLLLSRYFFIINLRFSRIYFAYSRRSLVSSVWAY